MTIQISETLHWRPIAELSAAYPEPDHDIWILLWNPEYGPIAQLLYGTDTRDLVTAGKWPSWAAVKGPTRPSTEALVADYGEDAVRQCLEGWDIPEGDKGELHAA
jgi:hypothetical protein